MSICRNGQNWLGLALMHHCLGMIILPNKIDGHSLNIMLTEILCLHSVDICSSVHDKISNSEAGRSRFPAGRKIY